MTLVTPLTSLEKKTIRIIRHSFTTLSILSALLTIFINLSCRDRSSQKYFRLILAIVVVSLICEMELQLVLDPIFLFPVPCVVRDEPLVNLPGRTSLHYVAWIFLLVIVIPLFFACFVYRHQAVMIPGSRWSLSPTKQTAIPLLYALSLFGFPPINYYTMQPPGSIEQYSEFLSPDWPPAVLDRTDCLYPDRFLFMCILSVVCIIIFFVLAVTIVAQTFATLRNHATMSDKMREYHRTMTKVLVLQSGVPVVFAQQPLFFMILTYFLNWNGHLIVPICLTITSSHSFLHSIAVLATTPVYRKYCATMLFRKVTRQKLESSAHLKNTEVINSTETVIAVFH